MSYPPDLLLLAAPFIVRPGLTAALYVQDLISLLGAPVLLAAITIAAVQMWRRRPFGYLLSGVLLIKAAVPGVLLAVSTLWAVQLGYMALPVEELGMYLFLTVAGSAGVYLYMRHLHGATAPRTVARLPLRGQKGRLPKWAASGSHPAYVVIQSTFIERGR